MESVLKHYVDDRLDVVERRNLHLGEEGKDGRGERRMQGGRERRKGMISMLSRTSRWLPG